MRRRPGSGGQDGQYGGLGGNYGGGAAPSTDGPDTPSYGGSGAVRIIWGAGRSFPSSAQPITEPLADAGADDVIAEAATDGGTPMDAATDADALVGEVTFDTPGTYTWIVPPGVATVMS